MQEEEYLGWSLVDSRKVHAKCHVTIARDKASFSVTFHASPPKTSRLLPCLAALLYTPKHFTHHEITNPLKVNKDKMGILINFFTSHLYLYLYYMAKSLIGGSKLIN